MDVIGFVCASLGSSTVQLHDSVVSRRACACSEAGFRSQNGDRSWGVYCRKALILCVLWPKGLNAKDIHKEMLLFTVGSVCRVVKRFTAVWQTFRWWRRGLNGGGEVAETLCCGFRLTGKAMGQVYQCWWRVCREINVFPGSNITCFTFYIHSWPIYWLSYTLKQASRNFE
jgi:hypothetical protein